MSTKNVRIYAIATRGWEFRSLGYQDPGSGAPRLHPIHVKWVQLRAKGSGIDFDFFALWLEHCYVKTTLRPKLSTVELHSMRCTSRVKTVVLAIRVIQQTPKRGLGFRHGILEPRLGSRPPIYGNYQIESIGRLR